MPVVPKDSVLAGPKSSVQKAIELQISEMERLAEEEIKYFDQWVKIKIVQPLLFFKENKGSFAKALKIEQKVFAATRTNYMMYFMSRKNQVLLKIKIQKMNDALDVLLSNYDFQGLTAYYDQAVTTQLFNNLRTLEVSIFVIKQNLKEDAVVGILEPFCS